MGLITPYHSQGARNWYATNITPMRVSETMLDLRSDFCRFNTNHLGVPGHTLLRYHPNVVTEYPMELPTISYQTSCCLAIKDGHKFKGKVLSNTVEPSVSAGALATITLFPETSAYIGNYTCITLTCFADVYKLLGGRSFCANSAFYWCKGTTTKLGLQLVVKAVKDITDTVRVTDLAESNNPTYDSEALELFRMVLASYDAKDVQNLELKLCEEFSQLIFQDIILEWDPFASESIIKDLVTFWLKPNLFQ